MVSIGKYAKGYVEFEHIDDDLPLPSLSGSVHLREHLLSKAFKRNHRSSIA